MTRLAWLRCTTLALVLTATACGQGASTPDSGRTVGSASPDAAGSTGPPGSATKPATKPATEPATEPPTEGTGVESPQAPNEKASVVVASPLDSLVGGLVFFNVSHLTNCIGYPLLSVLDEDVVAEVILSPEAAFVREDAACRANIKPCFDFVFRAGQPSTCYVGVRWRPETKATTGKVTLKLTAVCEARGDRLCKDLADPPPPGGINVVALVSTRLSAKLPDGGTHSTSVPPVDPGAGSSSTGPTPTASPFASPAS